MKLDKKLISKGIFDAFEHYGGAENLEGFVEIVEKATEERIIKLLDTSRLCTCNPGCKTDVNVVAFVLEELKLDVIKLIRNEQ